MVSLHDIGAVTARERALIRASRGESNVGDKVAALADVVRVLEGLGLAHALVGGVAVGIHSGVARATEDVDVAIGSDADRSIIVQAMVDAGFEHRGTHAHSINFRHQSGEPVQLCFDASFDAMIERAVVFSDDIPAARIVTKEDLIAMKERAASDPAGRRSKAYRDRADVELLRGDVPDPDEGW